LTVNGLGYYDIATEVITDTQVSIYGRPSISGAIISFTTKEVAATGDLNDDGDLNDFIVRYYDMTTGEVPNTGLATDSDGPPVAHGTTITFDMMEWWGDKDLNGDRDLDDYVIRQYDIVDQSVRIIHDRGANRPFVEDDIVVYVTSESWVGLDLDSDGDQSDHAVGYVDLGQEVIIDEISVISDLVDGFAADGSIANTGIVNALRALLTQAQARLNAGDVEGSVRLLRLFIDRVGSLEGKQITFYVAQVLVTAAEDFIATL
jgi:hypothetical protein